MSAVIDHHGPFWIGMRRDGRTEEWAGPFTAPDQDTARSVLVTLGVPNVNLFGPYTTRSDAHRVLDKWLAAQ